jgi:hypothetical protein
MSRVQHQGPVAPGANHGFPSVKGLETIYAQRLAEMEKKHALKHITYSEASPEELALMTKVDKGRGKKPEGVNISGLAIGCSKIVYPCGRQLLLREEAVMEETKGKSNARWYDFGPAIDFVVNPNA